MEHLAIIRKICRDLEDAVCTHSTTDQKLEFIRKIGALTVRCMEQHGAPLRAFPYDPDEEPDEPVAEPVEISNDAVSQTESAFVA